MLYFLPPPAASLCLHICLFLPSFKGNMEKGVHCWGAACPKWVTIWPAERSKTHRSSSSKKPALTAQPRQHTLLSGVTMLHVQGSHMFPTKS